jgi:hypothetical protein
MNYKGMAAARWIGAVINIKAVINMQLTAATSL